jgi:hypothetical protein
VPGTLVLIADGTNNPIDQVQVGDVVQATDPDTGETGPQKVLAPLSSEGVKNLVQITIETHDHDRSAPGTLTVTDNHPSWPSDLHKWVPAGD